MQKEKLEFFVEIDLKSFGVITSFRVIKAKETDDWKIIAETPCTLLSVFSLFFFSISLPICVSPFCSWLVRFVQMRRCTRNRKHVYTAEYIR